MHETPDDLAALLGHARVHHLGRAGIFVRRFDEHATWLRLGLPADEQQWERLHNAMVAFRRSG